MMARRSAEQRSRWVAEWRASGLTAGEFAGRHGLSANTLRYWAYRLKQKPTRAIPSLSLVRVERASERTLPPSPASLITIEIGEARVLVPAGSDAVTVRAVLDAVRSSERGLG